MSQESVNRGGAKYELVAHQIKADILAGLLRPGEAIDSESRLCSRFGISRGPVRQALEILERERLIYRVPGKGSFVTETAASHAPASRTKQVGVVIDASGSLDDNFVVLEIIEGLNRAVDQLGGGYKLRYEFHRFTSDNSVNIEAFAEGCDGLLVIPFTNDCTQYLQTLRHHGVPLVSFFDRVDTRNFSSFFIDHEEAARRATEFLIRYGHRRIALLLASILNPGPATSERFSGYRLALQDAGINFDPALVGDTGSGPMAIRTATAQLLQQANPPTALIIGGGLLTAACVQTTRTIGLKVPRDLSIVAFDDTSETSMHEPPLTVMKQPLAHGTRLAMETLVNEMERPGLQVARQAIAPELVVRGSCAVCPH